MADLDTAINTELDDRATQGFPERVRCPDGREVQLTPLADLLEAQSRLKRRGKARARLIYPVAE